MKNQRSKMVLAVLVFVLAFASVSSFDWSRAHAQERMASVTLNLDGAVLSNYAAPYNVARDKNTTSNSTLTPGATASDVASQFRQSLDNGRGRQRADQRCAANYLYDGAPVVTSQPAPFFTTRWETKKVRGNCGFRI